MSNNSEVVGLQVRLTDDDLKKLRKIWEAKFPYLRFVRVQALRYLLHEVIDIEP